MNMMADGGTTPEEFDQAAYDIGFGAGIDFVRKYPHEVHADLRVAVGYAIGVFWGALANKEILAPTSEADGITRIIVPGSYARGFCDAFTVAHPEKDESLDGEPEYKPSGKPPPDDLMYR